MSTTPHDYVEQQAKKRGLDTLLLAPMELARIAEGHPMVCATEDGTELLVKIPSPAEFMAKVARARENLGLPPT